MDHAVRLNHIGDGDIRDPALTVFDHDRAVFALHQCELTTANRGERVRAIIIGSDKNHFHCSVSRLFVSGPCSSAHALETGEIRESFSWLKNSYADVCFWGVLEAERSKYPCYL